MFLLKKQDKKILIKKVIFFLQYSLEIHMTRGNYEMKGLKVRGHVSLYAWKSVGIFVG